MKTTTGLLFLLLMAVLCNVMFARTQGSNNSEPTTAARAYAASELLQKRRHISVVSFPDSRNFFRGSPASEKSVLWKIHLALQLVKHPELDQRQKRVILDAISLSSPEFFTISNHRSAQKSKAHHAFESLKVQELRAFPHAQAAELFASIAGGKTEADMLKRYYDISALPLKKRKALFRNATSNDKSDLWRTHLALFFVKREDLNEWQKAIILSAMSLATPEHFEVHFTDSSWKSKVRDPLRSLEGQIVTAFSFDDAAKIFGTLGDDADLAQSSTLFLLNSIKYKPLSNSGAYKQWTHSRFGEQEMALEGSCQCSTESDWCPISKYCNVTNCSSTDSGCGTIWSYPCNGACR